MIRKNLILVAFLSILLLLGLLYSYFIRVEIRNIKVLSSDATKVTFVIDSKIAQHIKLHVGTKDELSTISCEDTKNNFTYYRGGHDYKQQEEVSLTLKKGLNHCRLRTARQSSSLPLLKQKISFVDYIFLFVFFALPLFHLLFILLVSLVNKIWNKENV